MRRRSQRHPAIETAVFAAALLLSAFIARELWLRRSASPSTPGSAALQPVMLNPTFPPLPTVEKGHQTEVAVTSVAPIKLSRVQRRKIKTEPVPAPK